MEDGLKSTPLSRILSSKASKMKIPLSGTFELSPICNFSCKMCYVKKTQQEVLAHQRQMMSLDKWLEIAREAKEAGMLFLLLTGGEPFLWPNFWELYEELIQMGMVVSINTNGSLMNADVIQRLKKNPPKKINLTLYGASDETYEKLCGVKGVFGKIDETIRELKKSGIRVKLNASMTPSNIEDMEKIVAYAKQQELKLDIGTYMFPPIRRDETMIGKNHRFSAEDYGKYHLKSYRLWQGEERYINILKQIKQKSVPPLGLEESCRDPLDGKIKCRAGKAAFWITWDGYMTPCGMMPEPSVDLYKKSFCEAWSDIVTESEKVSLSGVCEACPDRELCHTCAAIARAETGKCEGIPTYLCKTVEEFSKIAEEDLAGFNINFEEKESMK